MAFKAVVIFGRNYWPLKQLTRIRGVSGVQGCAVGLPRPVSDHCPIMLLDDNRDWGPKPFRFLDIWLSNPKCMKVAKEAWEEAQVHGWAGYILVQKLRTVKDRLKVWNKQDFGDINCALHDIESKLHHLDSLSEARQLTDEERALKLGDKNTRFFQISANNRFKRNLVGSIRVDGSVLVDPGQIKVAATKYFRVNFTEERKIRPDLGGFFSRKLNQASAMQLEIPFEEKEILTALHDCSSFKAAGPDGFNFSFVKKGWVFMKETEYWPISMVGWVYKVLSKVLANRIKGQMRSVIGEAQAAFIFGKQILDGVLIANEAIHSWKVRAHEGLVLKLDFERAFDCVNWSFCATCYRGWASGTNGGIGF
ncbi:uncharacterized protein LOC131317559 [Rhododendron vialii]|uniref:uncharacterized protein LOC131317559 n=1 Tax=Rhododendron vialii TaxID=182163 RepID=UPI00265F18BC|nr:uncharacterized protein LOC131317559 [Rhododendron vialii]